MIALNDISRFEVQSTSAGDGYCLLFGQAFIQIQRHPNEWRAEYSYGEPARENGWIQFGELNTSRLIMNADDCTLKLTPKLANRPIVVRPLTTVEIPAGKRATLYISTILWLEIIVNDTPLLELPAVRLSDTWFGPNTREGELCYASNTRARLNPKLLETAPYKALTPVEINNRGSKKLSLERLKVPVPALSLLENEGDYWTSGLQASIETELNSAKIKIDYHPPASTTPIAAPRQPPEKGVLHRALNLFLE
ncbi:MAG: hypothetical protein P8Y45_12035 [Exilibacterium sp.]